MLEPALSQTTEPSLSSKRVREPWGASTVTSVSLLRKLFSPIRKKSSEITIKTAIEAATRQTGVRNKMNRGDLAGFITVSRKFAKALSASKTSDLSATTAENHNSRCSRK